jgi:hypothetical protein
MGVGGSLVLLTIYGVKRVNAYIERKSEESGKRFAAYFLEELKKEGSLQYIPKSNPEALDPERIYKSMDELTATVGELTTRVERLEAKLG